MPHAAPASCPWPRPAAGRREMPLRSAGARAGSPLPRPARRHRLERATAALAVTCLVVTVACLTVTCLAVAAAADVAPQVMLDRVEGNPLTGTLLSLDARTARVEVEGRDEAVAVETIRRLVRIAAGDAPVGMVGVTLTDGSRLTGDDFTWSGETATIVRGDGRGSLPGDRVRMVSWSAPANGGAPAWLELLPDPLDSDVVVVGSGESLECVPCAITAVTADTVTVVLDGETIPVRREKIAGLRWLRADVPPGGIGVAVEGGTLAAAAVAWSADGLVLDDAVRLPAAWLLAIDYAAGRTISLVDMPPERVEVEPFFAGLTAVEGLTAFFSPRPVGADTRAATPPGLVVRPRTRAVWRVPEDARRFRAVILPAPGSAGDTSLDSGIVAIAVDGTEVLREAIVHRAGGAEPTVGRAVVVELSAARRLEIVVDFPETGGMGGPVLVGTPVFEK